MANDPKQKYNIFTCVFNADKKSTNPQEELALLQNFLLNSFSFVATIIHDKDITDNGEPKTIHLHAYIELNENHTKKQFLQLLTELLKIEPNLISVEGTKSNVLMVQYLTHKNQPNKTQYPTSLVKTNNEQLFESRNNTQYKTKEQKQADLLTDIINCKSMLDFANVQGVETANKYRNLFNQIKQESKQDIESLLNQIKIYEIIFTKILNIVNEPYVTNQDNELRTKILNLLDNYSINR